MTARSSLLSTLTTGAMTLVVAATTLIGIPLPAAAAMGDRVAVLQSPLLPPVEAGANFGEHVALDGNRAAVAAPLVGGNDGAVYVYERDAAGRWTVIAGLRPDDPLPVDFFGRDLAIDGDTVAVGGLPLDGTAQVGAVYVFTLTESGPVQEAKISDPNASDDGGFGGLLALQGDTLLVASVNDDVVHAFERSGTDWLDRGALVPTSTPATAGYGVALDLDGDRALVADNVAGTSGTAFVFDRGVTGTWSEVDAVQPPPSDVGGGMVGGLSRAALSGDTLAMGLLARDTPAGTGTGAVVVFEETGGSWTEVAEVVGSTVVPFEQFPGPLTLEGDVLAVAAAHPATNEEIFVFDGATGWSEVATLTAAGPGEEYAWDVATDGTRVLVGAPSRDVGGIADLGAGLLYEQNADGNWVPARILVGQEAETASSLGQSVVLDGNRAFVHAPAVLGGVGNSDSEVHVFTRSGGNWRWQTDVSFSSRTASLAVEDTTMAVGDVIASDGAGIMTGSVHVVELGAGVWTETAEIFPTALAEAGADFGEAVAVSGGRIAVGAPDASTTAGSGRVYVYEHDGVTWVESELVPPAGETRHDFGAAVAISGDVLAVGAPGSDGVDVYRHDGIDWQHEQSILPGSDYAGWSLVLDGTRLVVGAPDSPVAATADAPGQAFVYDDGGTGWSLSGTLGSDAPVAGDLFGWSVALDGDVVVVGEPGRDDGARTDVGGFSYFTFDSGSEVWEVDAAFSPPSTPDGTFAGDAVAVAGDLVVLGAAKLTDPLRDTPTSPSGGAYAVRVTEDPVAVDDDYAVAQNGTLAIPAGDGVLANDLEPSGAALTATMEDPASHGSVMLNPDGSFDYIPDAGFFGIDTFTYTVDNPLGATSNVATVTIAVSRPPVAVDDDYAAGSGTSLVVGAATGLLANDGDPDADAIEFTDVTSPPADGDVTVQPDGSFVYTPDGGFAGADTFVYEITDGIGVDTATVTIDVSGRPTAVDDAYVTDQDEPLVVAGGTGVLANDIDPEADPLGAIVATAPARGTVSLAADGGFTYDPDAGAHGIDTFTYLATDGAGTSDPATVTLTVNGAPTAVPDGYAVEGGKTLEVAAPGVLANDTDPEADALTAAVATDAAHGDLVLAPNGGFTYTPDDGYDGSDGFTYTASDGRIERLGTVTITVSPAPTQPPPDPEPDPEPDPDPADPPTPVLDGQDAITRCAGLDRITTAVCTSELTFATAGDDAATVARERTAADGRVPALAVVLARSDDFADALAGTPFAFREQAPLLLTATGTLSPRTRSEIDRVLAGSGTVWLLGGGAAISEDVASGLRADGYTVERLAGSDRYTTAVEIARRFTSPPQVVLVTTGTNFADAVAAGPAAIAEDAAILLSAGRSAVAATQDHLATLAGVPVFAVGGPAAAAHPAAVPVFGPDRVATAVAVAERFFDAPPAVGVARLDQFADALSGGVHIGRIGGPLLLTATGSVPDDLASYLAVNAASIDDAFLYGGEAAITPTVADGIGAAIKD